MTDRLDLLHAQIARQPEAPGALAEDVPHALSSLVLTLLAKRAEDRYQSPEGILGLAHRNGGDVVVEGPRPRIRNLDALPHPAFDLFPVHRYRGFYTLFSRRFRPLTLCTTRGCPYQCNFCYAVFGEGEETAAELLELLAQRPHSLRTQAAALSASSTVSAALPIGTGRPFFRSSSLA
jgi:hypothetical protein